MIASQKTTQPTAAQIPSKDSATKIHNENAYKVFFVDDDQMVLKTLEHHFADDSRLQIYSFTSGEACINGLAIQPDVIILDYNLSDGADDQIDGLDTLVKIKEQCPSAEIVILSGQMDIQVAVNALKKGAVDYVIKNLTMQFSVEKSINSILKSKALKKEIGQLSQVIKRDKLLIKGYTIITLLFIGLLCYSWIS